MTYRQGAKTLAACLEEKLAPHGFKSLSVPPHVAEIGVTHMFHRKTWNTNRAVVISALRAPPARAVEQLREIAGNAIGSSWWSQLGMQIVFTSLAKLDGLVDPVNTQGILVQSVFAIDDTTLESAEHRTWGQVFTGRFQDAIAAAIVEYRSVRRAN